MEGMEIICCVTPHSLILASESADPSHSVKFAAASARTQTSAPATVINTFSAPHAPAQSRAPAAAAAEAKQVPHSSRAGPFSSLLQSRHELPSPPHTPHYGNQMEIFKYTIIKMLTKFRGYPP